MKNSKVFKCGFYGLSAALLVLSGQAFAAKDIIYPSGAAATVNAASVTVSNNFVLAVDGSTTLSPDVFAADAIVVSANWSIQDRSSQPGTDSTYNKTATFGAATTAKPVGASDVSVAAIAKDALIYPRLRHHSLTVLDTGLPP